MPKFKRKQSDEKEKKDNEKKLSKIVKVEIEKVNNIHPKDFNNLLELLLKESLDIRNKTIELLWEWSNYKSNYYIKFNENPNTEDIFKNSKGKGYKNIVGEIYRINKDRKATYSGNIITNISSAVSKWEKYESELWKYDNHFIRDRPSIPSFSSPEIEIHDQAIRLKRDDQNNIICNAGFLGREGMKIADLYIKRKYDNYRVWKEVNEQKKKRLEQNKKLTDEVIEDNKPQFPPKTEEELLKEEPIINSSSLDFVLKLSDKYDNTTIINRIISGEYKLGASKLIKNKSKNKWMFYFTYKFPKPKPNGKLNKDNILGVDMGVNTPVYLAVSNSYERTWINGGEIEAFRKKRDAMKRSLQKQTAYCNDGKIGHGVKTRTKAVEQIDGKISRFKDTCNHKYSRFVVDFAIKNNCGVIQMEDLSGIADGEKRATFLGNWTFYDLQQKIKYKAKEHGIEVVMINPEYTSARCFKCGFIHDKEHKDKWRPKQEKFVCMNCNHGHKYFVHADYNAAKNIATKNIEQIIKNDLQAQRLKYTQGKMMVD